MAPMTLPHRTPLAFLPTPVHLLPRLSAHLKGPEIWIKRDDQTGLAFGGNKTRKLEFLIAEALTFQCDCLITAGAAQSNHCRQTAAAAAAVGLNCHLLLGGSPPASPSGNLLLDDILGSTIHWTGSQRKGELIPKIKDELLAKGHKPYVVPYGGSNATGAKGFVHAMQELARQESELGVSFDAIVFASSSGGTQAGLMVGKQILHSAVSLVGIRIDKEDGFGLPFPEHIISLANLASDQLRLDHKFSSNDLVLHDEYMEAGYGVAGEQEREAIRLLARWEGILVDPVYTARAFGALLDLVRKKCFTRSQRVLFWHTGGAPALFSYAEELANL